MTEAARWLVGAGLAQALLAMLLLVWLGRQRLPLVGRGEVRVRDIAISRTAWPEAAQKASNAFDNQFQLPMLFLAGIGLALWFGPTLIEAILGWAFVISRYIHAGIHITSNHVIRRFSVYTLGFALLGLFWLDLAIRLVLSSTF